MGAQLLGIEGTQVKIEVTINLSRSMLTNRATNDGIACSSGRPTWKKL